MDIRKVRWAVTPRVSDKESARKWRKKMGPDAMRALGRKWNLSRNYGITHEEYEMLFAAQGGVFGICRKPETIVILGVIIPLAVDHDHVTGEVRGLLCHACNQGVGLFGDSPEILMAAIAYLQKGRTKSLLDEHRKANAPKAPAHWLGEATEVLLALRKAEVGRRAQERYLRNEPVGKPARMDLRAPWIWEAMGHIVAMRTARQKANENAYSRAWKARKKARLLAIQ